MEPGERIDAAARNIIETMAADGSEPLELGFVKGFVEDAVNVLGVEVEQIVPGATFEDDLDADSLDAVEFGMAQEERHEISISEQELKEFKTVAAALGMIAAKIAAKQNLAAAPGEEPEPEGI